MKKTLISAILAASAASAMAIPAVGTLDIDFRTNDWAPANGQASFSFDNVTASAYSVSPTLANDGSLSGGTPGTLFWSAAGNDNGDGLGVGSLPLEEVDGTNALLVTFADPAGNDINGIWLTDIFTNSDGNGGDGNDEIGVAGYFDGVSVTTVPFTASQAGGNGELFVPLGPANLAFILFYSSTPGDNNGQNDYSVAGFTKVGVPDAGSTLALMGLAMIGVGAVRRTVRR